MEAGANCQSAGGGRKKLYVPLGKIVSLASLQSAKQSNQDHGASTYAVVDDYNENSIEEESNSYDMDDGNNETESTLQRDNMEGTMAIDPKTWQGDSVIIRHDGHLYPSLIKCCKKSGFEVSCMTKSGVNWKWPFVLDILPHNINDTITKILAPTQISNRDIYQVQFNF